MPKYSTLLHAEYRQFMYFNVFVWTKITIVKILYYMNYIDVMCSLNSTILFRTIYDQLAEK